MIDSAALRSRVDADWEPALESVCDYVRIPALSPHFDADWSGSGHLAAAVEHLRSWCAAHAPAGSTVEVHELEGRTPVIVVDVPPWGGDDDDTVLIYGHLDKQPPFEGWRQGLGPWEPVLDGDRLYGRGVADDGYAAYSALIALNALRAAGGAHARCVVLIEASEESGSPDLPAHLDALRHRWGSPSLVIGLDSGMADWEHLWVTSSLRGVGLVDLTVRVLTEGVHSGAAGGVVPSSFRILRMLLERLEEAETGRLVLPEFHTKVSDDQRAALDRAAELLGGGTAIAGNYPFAARTQALSDDGGALLEARSWGGSLEVIGLDGIEPIGVGGNVLRPATSVRLSMRFPPNVDARAAAQRVVEVLEADPPYGAEVHASVHSAESGWAAPPLAPWLREGLGAAAAASFGGAPQLHGEGGTIPFMGMLGASYPDAQFAITGVLGPGSNAHGPNEFLHLPSVRNVTVAVAVLLDAHARR